MEIKLIRSSSYKDSSDTIVLLLPSDFNVSNLSNIPDQDIRDLVNHLTKEYIFSGKLGDVETFRLVSHTHLKNVILAGLGQLENIDNEKLRKVIGSVCKKARNLKFEYVDFPLILDNYGIPFRNVVKAISESSILANYEFTKYKFDKGNFINGINIIYETNNLEELQNFINEGTILGEATIIARDFVNEPANILYPAEFAERVEILGSQWGFEVEVYDEQKINELNMSAFMEVAKGSDKPPRLIIMRYWGNNDDKDDVIGLVGKGVTYDSGGLSLKDKEVILKSKYDMGGAASVIGAISAIAKLNLKANVIAVVPACESMVSGKSYKPGDIINTMAGKSVFIGNTDAEGRLILADAVHYIIEKEKVKKVLDIATLTGAVVSTLGTSASAVIANDDVFYKHLETASQLSGEKIWRMPIFEEYRESLKNDVADLTNTTGHPQTITAALFIEEFVQNIPWIHMDIAGTALSDKDISYLSKGSTGVGVRNIYYLIKSLSDNSK